MLIKQNLSSLDIREGFHILQLPSQRAIAELEQQAIRPNFIFLDPPYQLKDAYRETLERLGDSELARQALMIVEHEKRFDPGEEFGSLHRTRRLEQGDAALSFYRRD